MINKDLKEKIKEWVREENLDILKEVRTQRTNFILRIKSNETSFLNFPIDIVSLKRPEGLILGFTGKIKEQVNRNYHEIPNRHKEKMLEELVSTSELFHLNFTYSSNIKETRFKTTKVIMPAEITKVGFFAVIWDLKDYKRKLELIVKKYNFFSTKKPIIMVKLINFPRRKTRNQRMR